jgi:hypothetical protein
LAVGREREVVFPACFKWIVALLTHSATSMLFWGPAPSNINSPQNPPHTDGGLSHILTFLLIVLLKPVNFSTSLYLVSISEHAHPHMHHISTYDSGKIKLFCACSLILTSQMHIWQTWVWCCAQRGAVEVLSLWRVLQLRRPGGMQPETNDR